MWPWTNHLASVSSDSKMGMIAPYSTMKESHSYKVPKTGPFPQQALGNSNLYSVLPLPQEHQPAHMQVTFLFVSAISKGWEWHGWHQGMFNHSAPIVLQTPTVTNYVESWGGDVWKSHLSRQGGTFFFLTPGHLGGVSRYPVVAGRLVLQRRGDQLWCWVCKGDKLQLSVQELREGCAVWAVLLEYYGQWVDFWEIKCNLGR